VTTPDNAEYAGGGTAPLKADAASAGAPPDSGASGDRASAGTPRQRFRHWRRSRPFWGGLLVLLAGAEILMIPLMNVIMLAAAGLMMSMGLGGISGFLIGIVLTACGVLLWFDPAHRAFYGIIALAGGVISFPATNFGGFFLGLLLAITGGALAVGWTPLPLPDAAGGAPAVRPGGQGGGSPHERGRLSAGPDGGTALAAVLVAGAVVAGPLLGARPAAAAARPAPHPVLGARPAAASASPAPYPAASKGCVLIIFCPGPAPSPLPSLLPPPGIPVPLPSPRPSGVQRVTSPSVPPSAGIVAYTAPVTLSAGAVRVTGFAYQGVAKVPTPGGGTVRMMKFTAKTLTASSGVTASIAQGGNASSLSAASLGFTGGITLYAAKFSGRLLGVPVTLTPGNAESVFLRLLKSATPAVPLTMTGVVANQPVLVAGSFQGQFAMSAR
jgi:hypothetical protein